MGRRIEKNRRQNLSTTFNMHTILYEYKSFIHQNGLALRLCFVWCNINFQHEARLNAYLWPSSNAWHSDLFCGIVCRISPSAVTYPIAHWPKRVHDNLFMKCKNSHTHTHKPKRKQRKRKGERLCNVCKLSSFRLNMGERAKRLHPG